MIHSYMRYVNQEVTMHTTHHSIQYPITYVLLGNRTCSHMYLVATLTILGALTEGIIFLPIFTLTPPSRRHHNTLYDYFNI